MARRIGRAVALAATGSTVAALAWAGTAVAPAGAATTVSSSGTAITVALADASPLSFLCQAGQVAVRTDYAGTLRPSPDVACTSLTTVTVNGSDDRNSINGKGLTTATFPALTSTTMTLGAGNDYVQESPVKDTVDLGDGNDTIELIPVGPTNGTIQSGGGGDLDTVRASGSDTAKDSMSIASNSSTATVNDTVGATTKTDTVVDFDWVELDGGGGDDTLSANGVFPPSTLQAILLYGQAGDDKISTGTETANIYGGTGTNVLIGGTASDSIYTDSTTDTIRSGAGRDYVYDTDGLHIGGRTFDLPGGDNDYLSYNFAKSDLVLRVRPSTNGAKVTASLSRNGQQIVPATVGELGLANSYVGEAPDHGLYDVQALVNQIQRVFSGDNKDAILDITVPTGTWSQTGTVDAGGVDFTGNAYKSITWAKIKAVTVHGPWTNANEGFAHRVTRDLVFRFPTTVQRTAVAAQLTAGTKTRAQVVQDLMDTDEYRGLDVDRSYTQYLRRQSDAGGRAYWVGRLDAGLSLRKLRANLFGSSEYYTRFGGGTVDGYVRAAYRDVLGREPDASGLAYWVGVITGGAKRGSVAEKFLNTTEARRAIVVDQFLRFLDRTPTASESSTWVTALGQPAGEQGFIAFLAGSSSYYLRD